MGLLFPSPSDSLNQIASFSVKVGGTNVEDTFKIFEIQTFKEINKLSRALISIIGGNPKENNFEVKKLRFHLVMIKVTHLFLKESFQNIPLK